MSKKKINQLRNIFCETFPDAKIPKNIEKLQVGDFDEWDSLGNFNLILEVEKYFKVKFNANNFSKISSIESIKKYLKIKN